MRGAGVVVPEHLVGGVAHRVGGGRVDEEHREADERPADPRCHAEGLPMRRMGGQVVGWLELAGLSWLSWLT